MKTETENTKLAIVLPELDKLQPTTKENILEKFKPYFDELQQFGDNAKKIVVKSVNDKEAIELSEEGLKVAKRIRIDSDKVRAELKRDSLDYGAAVQAVYKEIERLVMPIEQHFKNNKDFVKIQQEKVLAEIRAKREAQLEPYKSVIPVAMDLAMMTDDEFDSTMEFAKDKFETQQRIEKEKQEELEKAAKIEQLHFDRKEEILRLDLWQYLQEKQTQFGEMSENDFKAVLNTLNQLRSVDIAERQKLQEAKEKAEIEAKKLKEEQDKKDLLIAKQREAERKEFEDKLAKEREAREKQAEIDRIERDKIKKEADEKHRIEREALEKQLADNQVAQIKQFGSDKERLQDIIKRLDEFDIPEMQSEKAKKIAEDVKGLLAKVSAYIVSKF